MGGEEGERGEERGVGGGGWEKGKRERKKKEKSRRGEGEVVTEAGRGLVADTGFKMVGAAAAAGKEVSTITGH